MSVTRTVAGLACLAFLAGFGAAGAAGAEPERAIDESHPGYTYYRKYCASCHGLFADGLGPVVPALRTRPPGLTHLGDKYGTPLPEAALREIIAGQNIVRAHGSADMPVWGERLYSATPRTPATEAAQRQTLQLIVDYLQAIQRPAGDGEDS